MFSTINNFLGNICKSEGGVCRRKVFYNLPSNICESEGGVYCLVIKEECDLGVLVPTAAYPSFPNLEQKNKSIDKIVWIFIIICAWILRIEYVGEGCFQT